MIKNEEILLDSILPIWKKYPIDKFIFYNDNSTDNSVSIIEKHLEKDRFVILNDNLEKFDESYNRTAMLEYSRDKCDYIFYIDADELLSANLVNNFKEVCQYMSRYNLNLYWYNVVDSLSTYRYDPQYQGAFGRFITDTKHIGKINEGAKYHTCTRFPPSSLETQYTNQFGVIHLQALNRRFYAIKQLWYKHFENKQWEHTIEAINGKYDPVINNFNFNLQNTPIDIINGITFDTSVFDSILEKRDYLPFIKENYNEKLITFGKEYLC
jgi:regulator of RNase E activity RraB